MIGDAHPRLEVLDVSHCGSMDAFGLTFICEAVEKRNRAATDVDGTKAVRRSCRSPLRELRMAGLKRVSEWTMGAIARAFPMLEALDLSYAPSLSDACIERYLEWSEGYDALPGPTKMRKLYAYQCITPRGRTDDDDDWPSFVELSAREIGLDPMDRTRYKRRLTQLRHVNFSHCLMLTDRACSNLAYAVPNLEFLELAGIGAALEDSGLIRLLKTTPLIRKLDLEDASRITDDVLEVLTPPSPSPLSAALPITIPGQRPPQSRSSSSKIHVGERLEHLVVSYAALLTSDALTNLIRACPKLQTLEADNTRLGDNTVREFVELQQGRRAQKATLIAIDCASVSRGVIDELAAKGKTRPRAGWRGWHARKLGYGDYRDGDNIPGPFGNGLDECDERKVTLKSFRSWQVVDKWSAERVKRRKSAAEAEAASDLQLQGGGGFGNGKGLRWFGRRSGANTGANTPGSPSGEDDDRGCLIM